MTPYICPSSWSSAIVLSACIYGGPSGKSRVEAPLEDRPFKEKFYGIGLMGGIHIGGCSGYNCSKDFDEPSYAVYGAVGSQGAELTAYYDNDGHGHTCAGLMIGFGFEADRSVAIGGGLGTVGCLNKVIYDDHP